MRLRSPSYRQAVVGATWNSPRKNPHPQCHQPPHLTEHAELVADRIITFAEIVGRENVTAITDCGLGRPVHPQIAWAKLRALRDGAAIASKKLWS
jgi:hypothetical protein